MTRTAHNLFINMQEVIKEEISLEPWRQIRIVIYAPLMDDIYVDIYYILYHNDGCKRRNILRTLATNSDYHSPPMDDIYLKIYLTKITA